MLSWNFLLLIYVKNCLFTQKLTNVRHTIAKVHFKIKQKVKRKPKAGKKKVKIITVPLGTGENNIQTTESWKRHDIFSQQKYVGTIVENKLLPITYPSNWTKCSLRYCAAVPVRNYLLTKYFKRSKEFEYWAWDLNIKKERKRCSNDRVKINFSRFNICRGYN